MATIPGQHLKLVAGGRRFDVSCLGEFRIVDASGTDRTPRGRKARALVAYLALAGTAAPRERLAALLWGDRGEEQARASLRQAFYELRSLSDDGLLEATREQAAVVPDRLVLDLDRIEVAAGKGDIEALATLLDREAPDLLADLGSVSPDFDDWLRAERVRRHDRLIALAVEAGEAALPAHAAAVRRLADCLERLDALSEPVARLGMAADAQAGDVTSLHRRYQRFCERLRQELDAAPAPETAELFAWLRARGPAPAPPAIPMPGDPAAPASRKALRPRPLWLAVVVALLALGAIGAAIWWQRRPAAITAPAAVAVLPFKELQPGGDGYFATGVSEEILGLLARDPKLKVIGSTSASLFARAADPLGMAREVGVSHLLEGSVRSQGGRVLVLVRLVRTDDGTQLWSERYDRSLGDIFAVQNEIGAAVATRLATTFAPNDDRNLVTTPEVYDRYLAARSLMRARTEPAIRAARERLLEAVALDPDYAPAYASLSQATMLLADDPDYYGSVPLAAARAEAERHARRALTLAPTSGEAHAAYGLTRASAAEAIPYFGRAVVLDPQRAEAHRWLGQAYHEVGRHRDALREIERAAALEPLWLGSVDRLFESLALTGQRERIAGVAARFERLSTNAKARATVRMLAAYRQGRLADALRAARQSLRIGPNAPRDHGAVAISLAALGETSAAVAAMPTADRIKRLVLRANAAGLAQAARRREGDFWHAERERWGVADTLAGRDDALLLRLYDRRYAGPGALYGREPMVAMTAAPALVAALSRGGRKEEAGRLADLVLARLASDVRNGVDPAEVAFPRAKLLAAIGRHDEALAQLHLALNGHWANLIAPPFRPLAELDAFAGLRRDPRLAQLQTRLDAKIDEQRARLGLPPLGRRI